MSHGPIETRVARRFKVQADERMKALLLKLRKGADASLTMKKLIEVLAYLGGWRVEPFVGLVKLHGYGAGKDDEPSLEADENPSKAQADYERIKKDEVSALPSSPQAGRAYTMEVSEPTTEGFARGLTGFQYKSWRGAKGLRFTSPEGKVFELLPGKYDRVEDPFKMAFYHIRKWLREDTNFLDQISNALGVETYEREREEKKPRTRDNTGTCPCCFRNIKLKERGQKHPETVLHGYQRPGWGSAVGKCYGVDFPPFELSSEGTTYLVGILVRQAEKGEAHLKRLQAGEVIELYSPMGRKLTPETEGEYRWKGLIEARTHETEAQIKNLNRDIQLLKKLIAEWKEQPLPMEGDRVQPPPAFLR